MTTSVVIINWNGLRFLGTLFESLRAQSLAADEFEVIVVDNNSSDASVEFIAKKYPEIRLVKNGHNDGFARGCNIGIRQATGKYIVLVNNDMVLDKNWLKGLVAVADKSDATVGAVVSKVMFKNKPGYINNAGSILDPQSDWPVSDRGFMEKDNGQYDKQESVSALCGASVLLKRTMLEDIGVFDEAFFMYFEDADLSWRGAKKGWKYLYAPQSIALHEHTGSSKEGSDFFVFQVARNRLLILLKHGPIRNFRKVFMQTFSQRVVAPGKTIVTQRSGRRLAAKDLRLGLKIFRSFLVRFPAGFLRRYHVLSEKELA